MNLNSPAFWRELNPSLSVERYSAENFISVPANVSKLHELIIKEGYVQLNNINQSENYPLLVEAVKNLVAKDLLPVFAFVYDEFWLLQARFKNILSEFIGKDYKMLPAFWAWHVDPSKEEAGWEPHRDRDRHALESDGSPLAVTMWLPLNEANPMNGCIYLVPANRDRAYATERETNYDFEYAAVRALPANPGDALIWNHAILHWGARASDRATEPRMSIAFEYQRGDIKPMKDMLVDPVKLPSFEQRLDLIAKQIIQYTHMYDFKQEMLEFAKARLIKP